MNLKWFTICLLLGTLFPVAAQDLLSDKIGEIKGKVDEIVIKSEGKVYTFSGEEAEELYGEIRRNHKIKHLRFLAEDGGIFTGDSLKKKIIIKKRSNYPEYDGKDLLVIIGEDGESDDKEIRKIDKKIIVSEDEGNIIVKVTTLENGSEETEIYEGSAAEKYLEKMENDDESENNFKDKKREKITIEKEVKEN